MTSSSLIQATVFLSKYDAAKLDLRLCLTNFWLIFICLNARRQFHNENVRLRFTTFCIQMISSTATVWGQLCAVFALLYVKNCYQTF